ncbi:MAG TPA: cytochrome c oxidase subunit II [Gemmatimonadetes bacterium]|nr:cytochrome c oxidase subunit II [Gemmatimonadota bacterium]
MNLSWLMPESVSTFGPALDNLYYVILWITGIVFVVTEVVLVYFIIKYRHKEGRKATYIEGSSKAEWIWTSATAVIVMALAIYSKGIWDTIRHPDMFPENAYELNVTAKQYEWNAAYAGSDGQLGTSDDIVSRNQVHVPVDQPVIVNLQSEDVIHSFFLPQLRVKHDAVPGRVWPIWFEATQTGEFPLACAELCGLGHYRMGGTLIVHSKEDFDIWLSEMQIEAEDDE